MEGCKDAKEVVALAKANGVTLSEKDAERVCEMFNGEALTDEELDQIVGGSDGFDGMHGDLCPCDKDKTYGCRVVKK